MYSSPIMVNPLAIMLNLAKSAILSMNPNGITMQNANIK